MALTSAERLITLLKNQATFTSALSQRANSAMVFVTASVKDDLGHTLGQRPLS
jgi:hypothetical protein